MTQPEVTAAIELLPCPFCGHLPVHRQLVNDGRWETSCHTVNCIRPGVGPCRPEAKAISAWNTRARPTASGEASDAGYAKLDEFFGGLITPMRLATLSPVDPAKSDVVEKLRAIIVAVPISSMVGRIVSGRKVRNYEEAKSLLEAAATLASNEQPALGQGGE